LEVLLSYAHVAPTEDPLHGRYAKAFATAAARCSAVYLARPTAASLLDILLLPKVLALAREGGLGQPIAETLRKYPNIRPPAPLPPPIMEPLTPPRSPSPPIPQDISELQPKTLEKAQKLLKRGYLSRAVRTLISDARPAPLTAENLEILRKKHPPGPPRPFGGSLKPRSGRAPSKDTIWAAIRSLPTETSAGLSGWTKALTEIATKEPQFASFLELLGKQIVQGTAHGRDLLLAARLVALTKEDGGLRPIAVGDLLYRVVAKAILRENYSPSSLLPYQLGVGSPGGVEPALRAIERTVFGDQKAQFSRITSLDFSNAFNTVDRTAMAKGIYKYAPDFYRLAQWAYGEPSILATTGGPLLTSAQGVRQG
ncbi:hypothetical protein P152DRAFT_377032, partial [Eremomyces bilateralis CBS 781.70]